MHNTIALIAHDNCKEKLLEWTEKYKGKLQNYSLVATGNTGRLISEKLGLEVKTFQSGPLGGDLQIGAGIVNEEIGCVIFFWDPLAPHPHDVDVKALLRIAVVKNIPIACNVASADLIITALNKSENLSYNNDLDPIIDKFLEENKAAYERYAAGFESLLEPLAKKLNDTLGGEYTLEDAKEILAQKANNHSLKFDSSGVLKLVSELYANELPEIIEKYLQNQDGKKIKEISDRISKIDWRYKSDQVFNFLTEYIKNNYSKDKMA